MRGFCGIGIEAPKAPENVGGLWRSAHAFGAGFIFTVGHRYPKQPSDTTKAWRHIPLWEFDSPEAMFAAHPREVELIGVECGKGDPKPLTAFTHPERAIYVLGAEDRGLSDDMLRLCDRLVEIPSGLCLNVATAGSIVLYDRRAKQTPTPQRERP